MYRLTACAPRRPPVSPAIRSPEFRHTLVEPGRRVSVDRIRSPATTSATPCKQPKHVLTERHLSFYKDKTFVKPPPPYARTPALCLPQSLRYCVYSHCRRAQCPPALPLLLCTSDALSVCARVPVVTRCRVSREACYVLAPRCDVLCQTIDTIGMDGQK